MDNFNGVFSKPFFISQKFDLAMIQMEIADLENIKRSGNLGQFIARKREGLLCRQFNMN